MSRHYPNRAEAEAALLAHGYHQSPHGTGAWLASGFIAFIHPTKADAVIVSYSRDYR